MSKLQKKYQELKKISPNKIYLFKSGIFYISIEDDAKILSNLFNFKIVNLNDDIIKCGFPKSRLDFYLNQLKLNNIDFQIIDSAYASINNYTDYLNNEKFNEIIKTVLDIDFDNISFKDSFYLLLNIKKQLVSLKGQGE